ncbi:MAG: hypothetical protein K0R50_4810 [Eubacterium sp.]|nr:hypothetical protein [Eubacterium sp.]
MEDKVLELLTRFYNELNGKMDSMQGKMDSMQGKMDRVSKQEEFIFKRVK